MRNLNSPRNTTVNSRWNALVVALVVAATSAISPLALAGDLKNYSAVGVCNHKEMAVFINGDVNAPLLSNGRQYLIGCDVPRDLPQKLKIKKILVGVKVSNHNPADGSFHGCRVIGSPLNDASSATSRYLKVDLPDGAVGTQILEINNFRGIKHGRTSLWCSLPPASRLTGISVEE